MKILDWICAVIVLALGVVHCVFTPFAYHSFSLAALWFLGTGLALIFGGMLNVLRLHGGGSLTRTFSVIANACMLAVALLFALKVSLAHNPQGIVLLVVLAGELLFSLSRRR
jgi:uncharacterized membrane protein YbaN (DUF454 family)